ncbi:LA_2272 family surface repeat-containing protein [Psychroserpens sp. Hel_I_66]|uniref:LA_2272 family surface repeat-containing protein n=1 Tax=Psychroserpens sp. Hel_I_66 TaxID=1250004 RepID=UPI0006900205|nr:hypothetical protein [Psychroserpens sp. Hel_I_66]
MKKNIIFIFIVLLATSSLVQSQNTNERKLRFPVWITHSQNSDIIGLSLAAFPKGVIEKDTTLTRTYGIRFEASLIAMLSPLMGRSPVSTRKDFYKSKQNTLRTEIINGLNLSSGTFGETTVNGFSASLMIQYLYNMDGVAIAGLSNLIEKHNGIAISALGNEVYKSNGLLVGFGNEVNEFNGIQIGAINGVLDKGVGIQIGIFNKAKNFKGIQIGLWNKNDKRSFPIINWQFK